jgi:hypothetical protein
MQTVTFGVNGGAMSRTDEFAQRERRALELLGSYVVKTAGGLMLSGQRRVIDGWLYASNTHLLFLSDTIMGGASSGMLDARTLLIEIKERPHTLTAPFISPNGIIDYGGGLEFVGAKKQIKAISALSGRS